MSNSVLYCIKIGGLNVSSLNIENVVKGITSNVFHQNYEIHPQSQNHQLFQNQKKPKES